MLIRLLSAALVIIGAAGFLAPSWLGSVKDVEAVELPLVEISDVAVSPDGRIYFALTHLSRVQVYTKAGRFIRNIAVDNAGGTFCVEIADKWLTVAVARRDAADMFDLDGRLVNSDSKITRDRHREICRRDPKINSVTGAFTGVTVNFAAGDRVVLARQPWHYLALGPFPSWLMFAIGLLLWPEWRRGILKMIKSSRSSGRL